MIRARIRLVAALSLVLAVAACGPDRVRSQSRYFTVHHAVLLVDAHGRGAYSVRLDSIRNVPELSVVEIELERPGWRPWRREITVRAGQRRFEVETPAFEGFEVDSHYRMRVRLVGLDRYTVLDNLRQRIYPTRPGAAD